MSHATITDLLAAWTDAETRGAAAALAPLLTDDFIAVGPLGFTLSKTDWLARHDSGALKYGDFRLDDVSVREFGAAAVIVATEQADGTFNGHPLTIPCYAVVASPGHHS